MFFCLCVCPTNEMIIYELWRHIVCYGACLFIVHILFYQTCVTEWQITQAAAVVCQCQTIAWNRPCPLLLLFFLIKWKFYLNASRIQIMLIYAVNSHPLINDQVRFVTVTHSLCWLNSCHINPNFHARLFLSLVCCTNADAFEPSKWFQRENYGSERNDRRNSKIQSIKMSTQT